MPSGEIPKSSPRTPRGRLFFFIVKAHSSSTLSKNGVGFCGCKESVCPPGAFVEKSCLQAEEVMRGGGVRGEGGRRRRRLRYIAGYVVKMLKRNGWMLSHNKVPAWLGRHRVCSPTGRASYMLVALSSTWRAVLVGRTCMTKTSRRYFGKQPRVLRVVGRLCVWQLFNIHSCRQFLRSRTPNWQSKLYVETTVKFCSLQYCSQRTSIARAFRPPAGLSPRVFIFFDFTPLLCVWGKVLSVPGDNCVLNGPTVLQ